jgi:flagellar M-ring protein FliF
MNNLLQSVQAKLKELNNKLDLRQKLVLLSLFILTFSILIWLITWSAKVDYTMLFGNLTSKNASEIIKKLEEQNVKYKLVNSGTAIMVPKDKVYKLRIQLSSEGMVSDGSKGFEIFDKTSLGMTDFVQNIDYQRAMEGELKRTIQSINGIDFARIHLVFPKEKVFKEDQKKPTASVFLKLKKRLTSKQVQGIANLISSAIEGMDASDVTILDQNGNTLTENYDDSVSGLTNYQMKLQSNVEKSLTTKVQTMLDNIVGPSNSVVRISAELNFDNIESTQEKYDPTSKVVRSEEVENSKDSNQKDSTSTTNEHIISNYEINKTVQHITNQVGNIKRLTVAVNVNQKIQIKKEKGKVVKTYEPRTNQEIAQLENLVKSAVGFDANRGDQIVVNNMKFDDTEYQLEKEKEQKEIKQKEMINLAEKGIVLIALIILIFVLVSQFKKIFAVAEEEEELVRPVLVEGEATEGFYPEGEEGMPMGEGKISYAVKPMKDIELEQTETQQLQETVKKFVMENPEVAVKLIKSWLLERRS